MLKDVKIAYEPHPVSPERKKELRAKGFRIVDAQFAPKDAKPVPAAPAKQPDPLPPPPAPAPAAPAEKPKLGLPKKD